MDNLHLSSPAFDNDAVIPQRFTCEGENISPPLRISGVPGSTQELVLIVTDPDIPQEVKDSMGIEVFGHWVAYGINPETTDIAAGQAVGTQGENSNGELGYTGPCPPAEYEPTEHRYVFALLASDAKLDLKQGANKDAVQAALDGHVLASDKLVGRYEKQTVR